jgi:hypothetical protein
MASSIFIGGEALRETWCNVLKPSLATHIAGPYRWPQPSRERAENERAFSGTNRFAYLVHVKPKPMVWG